MLCCLHFKNFRFGDDEHVTKTAAEIAGNFITKFAGNFEKMMNTYGDSWTPTRFVFTRWSAYSSSLPSSYWPVNKQRSFSPFSLGVMHSIWTPHQSYV